MERASIYGGIPRGEFEHMMECFNANIKKVKAGESVLNYAAGLEHVCVILSGAVEIHCIDEDGNLHILETLDAGEVFGEIFSLPTERFAYIAIAKDPSEILFIDYARVVCPCVNVCDHHKKLIHNLFLLSAEKARELSKRINVLSQRTLRQKLILYLETIAAKEQSRTFEIPMTLSSLADYLSADRTAMMRELQKMRADGLIESSGRQFRLL